MIDRVLQFNKITTNYFKLTKHTHYTSCVLIWFAFVSLSASSLVSIPVSNMLSLFATITLLHVRCLYTCTSRTSHTSAGASQASDNGMPVLVIGASVSFSAGMSSSLFVSRQGSGYFLVCVGLARACWLGVGLGYLCPKNM